MLLLALSWQHNANKSILFLLKYLDASHALLFLVQIK